MVKFLIKANETEVRSLLEGLADDVGRWHHSRTECWVYIPYHMLFGEENDQPKKRMLKILWNANTRNISIYCAKDYGDDALAVMQEVASAYLAFIREGEELPVPQGAAEIVETFRFPPRWSEGMKTGGVPEDDVVGGDSEATSSSGPTPKAKGKSKPKPKAKSKRRSPTAGEDDMWEDDEEGDNEGTSMWDHD